LGEARVHRAGLHAGVAVDALLGVDVEHLHSVIARLVWRRVDAVDGAHLDAGVVLRADARLGDYVSHSIFRVGFRVLGWVCGLRACALSGWSILGMSEPRHASAGSMVDDCSSNHLLERGRARFARCCCSPARPASWALRCCAGWWQTERRCAAWCGILGAWAHSAFACRSHSATSPTRP